MPTELTAQFRSLAGATVPHDFCSGRGVHGRAEVEQKCQGCEGTGRVYLFGPEVRVPCGCPRSIDRRKNWVSPCISGLGSKCPGWVPSGDGWVWANAASKVIPKDKQRALDLLGGREHFLEVVLQAVQTIEGVQLG